MTPEEQQLLTALSDRIKGAPTQQHDADADQILGRLLRDRPDTPYLLAQTVLMQELAMRNAQAQIGDLQRQLSEQREAAPPARSGGFLSGLFGGGAATSVPPANPWSQSQGYAQAPVGYQPVVMQPSQTSGFLRSAATTAAGIAGGALLFEGIESLFGAHQGYGGFMSPAGWDGWGGGGAGGFEPRESLSETTINNNYYGGAPESGQQNTAGGGQNLEAGAGYQDQGSYQNVSDYDPGNLDPGNVDTGNFDTSDAFGSSDGGSDGGDYST